MIFEHFKRGINIAGWLSQYDCLPKPPETREEMKLHLETFLTERDFERIRSWGLDHVRLTLDNRDFEEEPDSLMDRQTAFHYMDLCLAWCRKYGLNVIFDLHRAQGVRYDMEEPPTDFLTKEENRLRFIRIWEEIAQRYRQVESPVLMFELLNEVCDCTGYLWNELYTRTVSAIRKIDPTRYILVGSNEQNSVFRLKELRLLEDENVIYNFHFYEPLMFTHQKAHFSRDMVLYGRTVEYPGEIPHFTDFLREHPQYLLKFSHVAMEERVDKDSMKRLLKDAFDFVKYSGKELYCGELGVIDTVCDADAADWIRDCTDLLEEHGIGHAIWNYKEEDFGFVDMEGELKLEGRLRLLFGAGDQ